MYICVCVCVRACVRVCVILQDYHEFSQVSFLSITIVLLLNILYFSVGEEEICVLQALLGVNSLHITLFANKEIYN